MTRRANHSVPDEGTPGRKTLPKEKRVAISRRLKAWYHQRHRTQQAFAEKIGVPRATLDGWFGADPHSPELLYVVKMAEEDRLSPTFLLTGQGPDHIGADRPLTSLAGALHRYVAAEIHWQCSPDERGFALGLLPEGQELLDNFVEHYWATVIAPALSRAQLAEGLEIVRKLRRQQQLEEKWKPTGDRIRDAMTRPSGRATPAEAEKLATIAERALGKRPFRSREKSKLKASRRPTE
jgi:transcriptional regulator with XRE-family HTH domain